MLTPAKEQTVEQAVRIKRSARPVRWCRVRKSPIQPEESSVQYEKVEFNSIVIQSSMRLSGRDWVGSQKALHGSRVPLVQPFLFRPGSSSHLKQQLLLLGGPLSEDRLKKITSITAIVSAFARVGKRCSGLINASRSSTVDQPYMAAAESARADRQQ